VTQATPEDWILPRDTINALQQESIRKLVTMCRGAHTIDVIVRYEGQDHRFQADWIKHLRVCQQEAEQAA
jgi:hypothetical protein